MIAMDEMEDRRVYRVRSRNLIVGVWVAEQRGIVGIRRKFDSTFPFVEFHHEADPHVGTARPEFALDLWAPPELSLAEYSNPALMEFLQPIQDAVAEELAAERAVETAAIESRRWAPQTLAEHLGDRNTEAVRRWWAASREPTEIEGTFHDRVDELRAHFKAAREAAARHEEYAP